MSGAIWSGTRSVTCRKCGAGNLSIDLWCSSCHQYLDWEALGAPPAAGSAAAPSPNSVDNPPRATAPAASTPAAGRPHTCRALIGVPVALGAAVLLTVVALAALPSIKLPATAARGGLLSVLKDAPIPRVAAQPTVELASQPQAAAFPAPAVQPEGSIIRPAIVVPSQAPVVGAPAPLIRLSPVVPLPVLGRPQAPVQRVQPPIVLRAAPATSSPIAAINAFYAYVTQHNFGAAASTWSTHMRAEYPPPAYINDRFAATSYIGLQSGRVTSQNGTTATVSVYIVEIYAGRTRHWAGSWQLVRSGSGWLLDQPYLGAA